MYDYNEEEVERFGREGGAFLIREGIVKTSSLEEINSYKNRIEGEEEIEKTEGRKSFNIIKIRGENEMENEFGDSAFNDYRNLKDLAEDFLDEEIGGDFEKNVVLLPEKLKEALEEAYRNLIAYRSELEKIPELLSAVQLMASIATGKPALPSKYPYPKKVEKSMSWSEVQDMLFGGHLPPPNDYPSYKA
ncbi:hypothetical protein ES708_15120 [subsurface metagenome]